MSFENTDINTKFCPLISASITVPYNPKEKTQLTTIFSITINCIMWPVGISANVLVFITVLRKPQLRTVYNTSVLWLIAGDLCVILLAQTCNIVYLVNKFTTGDYSCPLFFVYNLFTWCCHGLSFFTLLFISIKRYFAVFWPFKYEDIRRGCARLGALVGNSFILTPHPKCSEHDSYHRHNKLGPS